MTAGQYCNREVTVIEPHESVRTAVELMRTHHVGDVVVVERSGDVSTPTGILTDRDIVIEILAKDADLGELAVGDVMSGELHTVQEDLQLLDAIKEMRSKGVRRLPVVDERGDLVGILTVDDVLGLVSEQLTDIVGLIVREQVQESRRRD